MRRFDSETLTVTAGLTPVDMSEEGYYFMCQTLNLGLFDLQS